MRVRRAFFSGNVHRQILAVRLESKEDVRSGPSRASGYVCCPTNGP